MPLRLDAPAGRWVLPAGPRTGEAAPQSSA